MLGGREKVISSLAAVKKQFWSGAVKKINGAEGQDRGPRVVVRGVG